MVRSLMAAAPCLCPAVEPLSDIRLLVGHAPNYRVQDQSEDLEHARRIGIDVFLSFNEPEETVAWIFGGEISSTRASNSGIASISQAAGTLFMGYAAGFERTSWLHGELTPFVGIGKSTLDLETSNESDIYVEYGVRAGIFMTLVNVLQIGGEARYIFGEAGRNMDGNQRDNEGMLLGLTAGFRF